MKKLYNAMLSQLERFVGESVDYLRFVAEKSPRLLRKFRHVFFFANCRKACPKDIFHMAGILGSLEQDCGTCVQISVNVAKKDGLTKDFIFEVMRGQISGWDRARQDAFHYMSAVLKKDGATHDLREAFRRNYGDEALIEVAYALASAQVYPVVKRTLGYAISCKMIEVR